LTLKKVLGDTVFAGDQWLPVWTTQTQSEYAEHRQKELDLGNLRHTFEAKTVIHGMFGINVSSLQEDFKRLQSWTKDVEDALKQAIEGRKRAEQEVEKQRTRWEREKSLLKKTFEEILSEIQSARRTFNTSDWQIQLFKAQEDNLNLLWEKFEQASLNKARVLEHYNELNTARGRLRENEIFVTRLVAERDHFQNMVEDLKQDTKA
jgi:hypothetical protein